MQNEDAASKDSGRENGNPICGGTRQTRVLSRLRNAPYTRLGPGNDGKLMQTKVSRE